MRIVQTVLALALSSMAAVACGAAPAAGDASESSASASTASVGLGGTCSTDSSCRSGLVCDLYCPVIPGRAHCMVFGGTCEPVATDTAAQLSGKSFASTDGAHTIKFTSTTEFSKTDGCATTGSGIHCNHIVVSNGTYVSYGSSIKLHLSNGTTDSLSVEPHPYDGLFDNGDQVELYPSN